jgi:TolB protein
MNLDGSSLRVLASGVLDPVNWRNNLHLEKPVLSPDRRLIAYVARGDTSDIYVMNVDGTQPMNITGTTQQDEWNPTWTTDGTGIVYRSKQSHISHTEVLWMVMRFDGSQVKEISEFEADRLTNRSGKVVKIMRGEFSGRYISFPDITIYNADGSASKTLTDNWRRPANHKVNYYEARLSPDAKRIAFMRQNKMSQELWIMNADGTGQRRLADTGTFRSAPVFTPDSKAIVYAAKQSGDDEIFIVTPGQAPVQLTHNSLNDDSPDVR